jgi:hypothetical protein
MSKASDVVPARLIGLLVTSPKSIVASSRVDSSLDSESVVASSSVDLSLDSDSGLALVSGL